MADRPEDPVVEVSADEEPAYEVRVGEAIVGPVSYDQIRRGRESGKIPDHAMVREVGPWSTVEHIHADHESGQQRDGLEVRYAENLVGPVTVDQLRRGRVAGRIPDGAEARWTAAWMPVDEALAPPEEPTDRKGETRPDPPTRQMTMAELQEAARQQHLGFEPMPRARETDSGLLEPLSDSDLEEVTQLPTARHASPETERRVEAAPEPRPSSSSSDVTPLVAVPPLEAAALLASPAPPAAPASRPGEGGPQRRISVHPGDAPATHGGSELPTRKMSLSKSERDAVIAKVGLLGKPAQNLSAVEQSSARRSQPGASRPGGSGVRPRSALTPAKRGRARSVPDDATSDFRALLLPFGIIAAVCTIVIGGGLSAGGMARRHAMATAHSSARLVSPPKPSAPTSAAVASASASPDAARESEPLWSPCLGTILPEGVAIAGGAPVPCGGSTLSVTVADGTIQAVLDGLARSSATVARMPSIIRVVLPNLPPPIESYTAERVMAPMAAWAPRPAPQDLVGALQLWDAAARATTDCRALGACRGAAWRVDEQELRVELGFDGPAMQLRFTLGRPGAGRQPQPGRVAPDVRAWPWHEELPTREEPSEALARLRTKLAEADWLPDDATAFVAAATRLGFKEDDSTFEGLAVIGAWLRQSHEWEGLARTIWSDCIETRARKLRGGDRAALEAFLGADPTTVSTVVAAGATPAGGPTGRGTPATQDQLRQAFRASIGTPAHAECAFRLETCRLAATTVPLAGNRVIREASPGGAAAARKLACQQRFGRVLGEELRRVRAPLLRWQDDRPSDEPAER